MPGLFAWAGWGGWCDQHTICPADASLSSEGFYLDLSSEPESQVLDHDHILLGFGCCNQCLLIDVAHNQIQLQQIGIWATAPANTPLLIADTKD
jgi:hypothetical protein